MCQGLWGINALDQALVLERQEACPKMTLHTFLCLLCSNPMFLKTGDRWLRTHMDWSLTLSLNQDASICLTGLEKGICLKAAAARTM